MMRIALMMAVLAAGCGPVWEGTWTGPSNFDEACEGFAPTADNFTTTWTISEAGSQLNIVSVTGLCGALSATAAGNTATMDGKLCPVLSNGQGDTLQREIKTGTLTLEGNRLNATTRGIALLKLANGTQSACINAQTSALSRVP